MMTRVCSKVPRDENEHPQDDANETDDVKTWRLYQGRPLIRKFREWMNDKDKNNNQYSKYQLEPHKAVAEVSKIGNL